MSVSLFIARKIYKNADGSKQASRPAIIIAMSGIAIGLAVMLITVSVAIGFKKEVKNKVTGFGSHIQVSNFDAVSSFETVPVVINDSLMSIVRSVPGVSHIQRYSTKPGIIKTSDAFQGMVLKGVGQEFDSHFFLSNLKEGVIPAFSDSVSSNKVIVSQSLANKLHLKLGDKILTYYIQTSVRVRPLTIVGIYETNLTEFDNLFLLTDIYTVNRLNNWETGQVSGAEIQVANYATLESVTDALGEMLDTRHDSLNGVYYVQNIEQLQPQIFDWLALLDVNVWVILVLMLGIAGFTMISGLLIIIIERTQFIGLLKALGATNITIRKVFLWLAAFLIGKGMMYGNIIALTFYFVQRQFHLFKLDPVTYYVDAVPVSLTFWLFLLINACTLLVSILMLVGPSCLITKINPATSMRYE